jgi:hypothetical protein
MDRTTSPVDWEGLVSLSRKRKKELHKLQTQANSLWESQQILVGEAANVAREASRQLGHLRREQVVPQVQATYGKYAAPVVDRGAQFVDQGVQASKNVLEKKIVPTVGGVVGQALSAWDAAGETRARLASSRAFSAFAKPGAAVIPQKKGIGAGGVFAIILGVAAAAAVLYAAWQTLRADDELWVADDPLRAPDA